VKSGLGTVDETVRATWASWRLFALKLVNKGK
jgi:hypothetical protein